jgi:4-diphosphocytidyl-2-C-methyl-D-erythritol kinase
MPSLPVVLVGPNVALSTANVFAAFESPWSKPGRMDPASGLDDCVQALAQRRNDLQPAAMTLQPEIGHVLDVIGASPGCALARMSGTGPVCFGIFGSAEGAKSAALEISNQHPGWWVVATTAAGT